MTPEEKQLVGGLFDRLRQADGQGKDAEAEALISQAVRAQPSAPYLLVQAYLVQEHALANAQAHIAALERQLQGSSASPPKSGGSFLGSLFGGGAQGQPVPQARPQQQAFAPQPDYAPPQNYAPPQGYAPTTAMAPSSGSGFLGSAVRTAAGVAGGALLFEGISSLLSHNAGPFSGGLGGLGGGGMMSGGGLFGGDQTSSAGMEGGGGYDPGASDPGGYAGTGSSGDPGYGGGDDAGAGNQNDDTTSV